MVIQKIRLTKDYVINNRQCRQWEVIPLGKHGLTLNQARELIEAGDAAPYAILTGGVVHKKATMEA